MSKKFLTLVFLLVTACIVSYIFYLNPDTITVRYTKTLIWTAPAALILIITFCSGVVITSLIAFMVATNRAFKDWQRNRKDKTVLEHNQLMILSREQLAAGNFNEARKNFQKIINQDSDNLIARVLLSETYEHEGNLKSAIQVLDQARPSQQQNIELLFSAARLNQRLGNPTAACDNLALVLKKQPFNQSAVSKFVFLARKLKRYNEAIEQQHKLVDSLPSSEKQSAQEILAELELLKALEQTGTDASLLRSALEDLLLKHRNFAPALAKLAELEKNNNQLRSAGKYLIKAYQNSFATQYLQMIADFGLEANDPAQALATIKEALDVRRNDTEKTLPGQIFLCSLYLHLEMLEECKKEFTSIKSQNLQNTNTDAQQNHQDINTILAFLEVAILRRTNKSDQACEILTQTILNKSPELEDYLYRSASTKSLYNKPPRLSFNPQPPPEVLLS